MLESPGSDRADSDQRTVSYGAFSPRVGLLSNDRWEEAEPRIRFQEAFELQCPSPTGASNRNIYQLIESIETEQRSDPSVFQEESQTPIPF